MKSFVKKYYDPDDPMWVIGCIDSYGAITARHAKSTGLIMHNDGELRGKRWRWNIWGQEHHSTRNPTLDRLSEEEVFAVNDWLERKGYKLTD